MNQVRARLLGLAGAALAVLVIGATTAFGVFPASQVDSYAGCLNTSGSAAGTITNVAVGDSPSRACSANQKVVHLGGGDITSVTAGNGLTGGGTNGAVTLSLAESQTLPTCTTSNQVPKWNGTGWSCGNDNDTTYGAGTGLSLNPLLNQFSIANTYRLPQSCNEGQVAKSTASHNWACGDDLNGQETSRGYWQSGHTFADIAQYPNETIIATLNIAEPGDYVVFASQLVGATEDNVIAGGSNVECEILTNGNELVFSGADPDKASPETITEIGVVHVVDSLVKVEVGCAKQDDVLMEVGNNTIIALKVGSLVEQPA